ncbi:hypothetical protein [Paenibacillus sp.]|uniref:hypothetical protein n=1 Tax=Paenibacillus sp. TaxID=58172 RepID=UPI002D4F196B|nr:hypothetical protein [Paenibacillus sp.]HZG57042.1 hypothetical protein [Paenibacillus sp.]
MEFTPATEVWNVRPVRWDAAIDHELTRRLYRVLSRWLPFADEQYADWDGRPNCGHFFGGHFWYQSDNASTSLVYAVLAKLGAYDEAETGIPRERVKARAIRAIRYMGFTHDTGPADCVRVEGVLPYTSGKKWGGAGDRFFLASQNGRSVAAMAMASLLLWDDMDDETKLLVQNVVASYADRWADEEPRNGVYYDTQCEENAWTAAGISAGVVLFPDHPHREAWKRGFADWAINTIATYRDRLAYPSGLVDYTDGLSVKSVTFHPDFTAENHAFVHPSYLCAGINLRALHVAMSYMVGEEPMPEAVHNNQALYERTLKPWMQFDGLAVPVQGQDWWYNRHHERQLTHTVLNVVHGDRDAAAFVREALRSIERVQASNKRGCLLEEDGEQCVINRAHGQFAKDLEHGSAVDLATSFLMYAFGGAGAEPSEEAERSARLSGVHEHPYGNTIVYRTPDSFASFTWRNNAMALTLPRNGLWSVTPLYASYTGIVRVQGRTGPNGLANEDIVRSTEGARIAAYDRGFGAVATIDRGGVGLKQDVAFAALPSGATVYVERFRAEADCEVLEATTGLVGIRNEAYAAMPELAPGVRTIHTPAGTEAFQGFYGREPNRERAFGPVDFVNVDGQIGYLRFGGAGVRYINKHEYPKWKGVEDVLILNDVGAFALASGECTEPFAVIALPNASAADTAAARAASSKLDVGGSGDAALLETADGVLVLVSFDDRAAVVEGTKAIEGDAVWCYEGEQRVSDGVYGWRGEAGARSCGYKEARFRLSSPMLRRLRLDISVLMGRAFVRNVGDAAAAFTVEADGVPAPYVLEPGAILPVELHRSKVTAR